jgi:hypothetical protein
MPPSSANTSDADSYYNDVMKNLNFIFYVMKDSNCNYSVISSLNFMFKTIFSYH